MNTKSFVATIFCSIFAIGAANATLLDRGNGTVYDTATNLSWMQDANLASSLTFGVAGIRQYGVDKGTMKWQTAVAWVTALDAAKFAGFDDWRLPTTVPGALVWTIYGSYYPQDYGQTGSELSSLFYTSLGNSSDLLGYDALQHSRPFSNARGAFWSATQDQYGNAWMFSTSRGYQIPTSTESELFAWAVRTGDTVTTVDEPATAFLLFIGMGLALYSRARNRSGCSAS